MAYPGSASQNNQLKLRILDCTTSSSGGRPVQVTVPFRSKYMSTIFSLSGESSSGGTSAIDIFYFPNVLYTGTAITAAPTLTTITSGFTISTSTGNASFQYTSTGTFYFNAGDLLVVQGSTGIVQYNATHILQEF